MVDLPRKRFLNKPTIYGLLILTLIVPILLIGCASQPVTTPQPQPTRDPNLEESIIQQLQSKNPDAVPLYQQATTTLDSGDLIKALDLYSRLALMVPDFSTAFRRISSILLKLNSVDNAIDIAQRAVELEPNAYNQSTLALAMLMKKTPQDSQAAFDLAFSAVQALPDDDLANHALLIAAMAINNKAVARQTDDRLLRLMPDDPIAHYYAGALAATDKNWEKAEAELLYSERLGMDPQTVQGILSMDISRNARVMRFLRWGGTGLAFWLISLGALFLVGVFLSRSSVQSGNEALASQDVQIELEPYRVRSMYRYVIAILAHYFYFSVPFVILLVVLLAGVAFYAFFLDHIIPVQLPLVLVILLVISLIAALPSLIPRFQNILPGSRTYPEVF